MCKYLSNMMLIKNLALYAGVLGQAFISLSNFLFLLISAKVLSLEEFAGFSVFWLIYLFLQSIHGVLYTQPLMSWNYGASKEKILIIVALIFPVFASLVTVLLIICVNSYHAESDFSLSASSLSVFLLLSYESGRRKLYENGRQVYAAICDLVSLLLRVLGLLYVYYFVSNVAVTESLFIILSISAFPLFMSFKEYRFSNVQLSIDDVMAYWNYIKWLVGDVLLQWGGPHSVNVVVGVLLGDRAFALYRLSLTLAGVLNTLLQGIENFLPSKILFVFKNNGKDLAWKELRAMNRVIIFPVIAILLIYGPVTYFILDWIDVDKDELMLAWQLVIILLFSMLLKVSFIQYRVVLRVIGATHYIFRAMLIVSICLVLISFPIISIMGLLGAALCSIVSDCIEYIVMSYCAKNKGDF